MRGGTLYVGNLEGKGILDFSDGTIQNTAYPGTTTQLTIPNQLTIKNSTNSTEVIISAGQDSSGNLIDDYIYYTGLNPAETTPSVYHHFEGAGVNVDTVLNVSGALNLSGALNVSGATTLETSTIYNTLSVSGTTTLENTNIYQTLNVNGLTTINNSANIYQTLNVNGATTLLSTLQVDGNASFGGQNTFTNTNIFNNEIILTNANNTCLLNEGNTILDGTLNVSGTSTLGQVSQSIGGTENTAFGAGALSNPSSGSNNTAFGFNSLENNTTGYSNTAIGHWSQIYNTTGIQNTSIGLSSLQNNTTGYNNTALGLQTLQNNIGGINNLAVGCQALITNTSGSGNVGIGSDALLNNTTGSNNLGIGYLALESITSGSNNTGIGYQSGSSISEGSYNTCIGNNSNITDGANYSTAIGYQATASSSNQIVLGTSSNSTSIPGSLSVAGSTTFTSGFACGNQSTPYIVLFGTATVDLGGSPLTPYATEATNTLSICKLVNMSFPTAIVGGYANTFGDQYVFASYVQPTNDSSSSTGYSTTQIDVTFVNFGATNNNIPDTVSVMLWGY
jgi:hypothetical protein